MPKALPKSQEISDKLIDFLRSDVKISEWDYHSLLKEIKALKDYEEEEYMLALAHAVYGQREKAIQYFEKSLVTNYDEITATNYLYYVAKSAKNCDEFAKLSARLADKYVSPELAYSAHYMNLYVGEFDNAVRLGKKYIKFCPGDKGDDMKANIAVLEEKVKIFKEQSGLSDHQLNIVTSAMATIMHKNDVLPNTFLFHSVAEESVNAYVIALGTSDSKKVAAMNFELAYQFAEHDELLGKNFSAWFQSSASEEQANGEEACL